MHPYAHEVMAGLHTEELRREAARYRLVRLAKGRTRRRKKEVIQVDTVIMLIAIVALLVAASVLGTDSRDGNDWGWHPRP